MVILNRRKSTTNKPMKQDTHSITDIEGLIYEKLDIIQNGGTLEEKRKARTQVIRLEKMLNDINHKTISKGGYEKKQPPKVSKKELLELIDSVGK